MTAGSRMSIETTICPRCESTFVVHLPKSKGFNQWICNQCSHQWDFASPEERALVPKHLTGGRIEQFLEEFLAIKVVIKGEAEKIWNSCTNAYQATRIASNKDKPRVFAEQVDRWRDQLIGLQETLIMDRLLPLVAKYQILSNEQMWLFRACHEAWSPVTAGYVDWFTFAIRGQLYGAGPWVIPEWAWQLRGAPRDIARLDVTPDQKASSLLNCLAHALQLELVVHRKEAIAKAFLARNHDESPSGLRFLSENLKPPNVSREDTQSRSGVPIQILSPSSIRNQSTTPKPPEDDAKQKTREAVIRKVQDPRAHTILSIPEAALYFEVQPRTIYRWRTDGKLRSGARRGSITIQSIRQWEKKRSRKCPSL